MRPFKLAIGMAVEMKVTYVDKHGRPAPVDGPVEWQSSDESMVRVVTDEEDSSRCVVYPAGSATGYAQLIATADTDLGDGAHTLTTVTDIEIVASQAVAGSAIVPIGDPEPFTPDPRTS